MFTSYWEEKGDYPLKNYNQIISRILNSRSMYKKIKEYYFQRIAEVK